jgi:CBS domain-containing protein
MTVRAILSRKGSDVITIEPSATLNDAVKVFAERRVGALLVVDAEGGVAGILSERDVVRTIADRGTGGLNERVDRIMTRKVFTCSETDTISHIMERMTAGKFRHVPVVEGRRLVGIVSIGDVVKHRLAEIERESEALRDYILTA